MIAHGPFMGKETPNLIKKKKYEQYGGNKKTIVLIFTHWGALTIKSTRYIRRGAAGVGGVLDGKNQ